MYKLLGFGFLGLATLGTFLPVLPTVPFLILAAGCFARSSETLYRKLLDNPVFGPSIRDWEEHRRISRKSRAFALTTIFLFGGYSVFFKLTSLPLQILCFAILAYGVYFILGIKVKEDPAPEKDQASV